jgi:geranylgeranyl transferase type-2 subunit beta
MALVSGPGRGGGGDSLPEELHLYIDKHVQYIQALDTRKDEYEYWLTEHLRLNGLYWGLTALHLLGRPDALKKEEVLDFVFSCLHDEGGFGAAPGHDAHMLYTVSAVQILATLDGFDELDKRVPGGRKKIGMCEFVPFHLAQIDLGNYNIPVNGWPDPIGDCSEKPAIIP